MLENVLVALNAVSILEPTTTHVPLEFLYQTPIEFRLVAIIAYSPLLPKLGAGASPNPLTVAVARLSLSITVTVLLVKVASVLFHSKTPHFVLRVSSQYVPPTGAPVGTVALGERAARSKSARTI